MTRELPATVFVTIEDGEYLAGFGNPYKFSIPDEGRTVGVYELKERQRMSKTLKMAPIK